jgi:hypothetical protein
VDGESAPPLRRGGGPMLLRAGAAHPRAAVRRLGHHPPLRLPQEYKHFIRSCALRPNPEAGDALRPGRLREVPDAGQGARALKHALVPDAERANREPHRDRREAAWIDAEGDHVDVVEREAEEHVLEVDGGAYSPVLRTKRFGPARRWRAGD